MLNKEKVAAKILLALIESGEKIGTDIDVANELSLLLHDHYVFRNFFISKLGQMLDPKTAALQKLNEIENMERLEREGKEKESLRLHPQYQDGFDTGFNWRDNYVPGGPFHFYPQPHDSLEKVLKANETVRAHKAWMQGWFEGRDKRRSQPKPELV